MKIKILIVNANYYSEISSDLLADVRQILSKNKIQYDLINVPGAFEIPVVISKNIKKYNGFIALGCIIKGETPHFEFISKSIIDGLMKLSIESKKPIGNGVLTCLNIQQGIDRSSLKGQKRKGREAAKATLSVLGVLKNESK